jgi:hypothetical protein
MARQDVVRALVPKDRVEEIVGGLAERFELDPDAIDIDDVRPGTYRDEQPDRELRRLVRTGRVRIALGATVGAVIGVAIALLVPALREWSPVSVVLFAFGGAWAAAAVVAARTVQVYRNEGDRPEKVHEIGPDDAARMQLVTVHNLRNRPEVSDHLADRGVALLDTSHPRVGDDGPGERPARPDAGGQGPPPD